MWEPVLRLDGIRRACDQQDNLRTGIPVPAGGRGTRRNARALVDRSRQVHV